MPSLLDILEEQYGTRDLYEALSVSKTASSNELKRAYYSLSLKVHPDRASENDKEIYTKKFQTLTKIYGYLSDPEKRACYDETGDVDDEDDLLSQQKDWSTYWRILYQQIQVKDIKEFEDKYRESDEEKQDVKLAYTESEGEMDRILEKVLCCQVEDEERFRVIIDEAIANGELNKFKAYNYENDKKKRSRRKAKANKEAKEAEETAKELGLQNGEDNLKAMILQRQKNRAGEMDSFFDNLEAKYCQPKKPRKAKSGQKKKA